MEIKKIYDQLSVKARMFLDSDPYCCIEVKGGSYNVDPTGHYGRCDMSFSEMDDYLSQLWDWEQELLREAKMERARRYNASDEPHPEASSGTVDISSDDLPF
jgi:hypothetical protein